MSPQTSTKIIKNGNLEAKSRSPSHKLQCVMVELLLVHQIPGAMMIQFGSAADVWSIRHFQWNQ
jgi:hypothetical protein